jgi:hypothetical protein
LFLPSKVRSSSFIFNNVSSSLLLRTFLVLFLPLSHDLCKLCVQSNSKIALRTVQLATLSRTWRAVTLCIHHVPTMPHGASAKDGISKQIISSLQEKHIYSSCVPKCCYSYFFVLILSLSRRRQ